MHNVVAGCIPYVIIPIMCSPQTNCAISKEVMVMHVTIWEFLENNYRNLNELLIQEKHSTSRIKELICCIAKGQLQILLKL